jgi:hypothetical protein
MNTNACHQKKFMLKICLSYLQLLIMNISFVFLNVKYVSVSGFSVAVNEIFVHMDTRLHFVGIKMCPSKNDAWSWIQYNTKGWHSTWIICSTLQNMEN